MRNFAELFAGTSVTGADHTLGFAFGFSVAVVGITAVTLLACGPICLAKARRLCHLALSDG
jgi:hypothetical protein